MISIKLKNAGIKIRNMGLVQLAGLSDPWRPAAAAFYGIFIEVNQTQILAHKKVEWSWCVGIGVKASLDNPQNLSIKQQKCLISQ